VVNDVPPRGRDVAMVFQNYALYPHMTVFQNMAFALKLRGVGRQETREKVLAVARTLELEELLGRRPRELSGGQRQRVAVGRAIVREPAAFLFDEPLSNLDAKLRVTTRAELKRLHQRLRTTTIYVTHDQEEAMTLGERIVVMQRGKIQQADAPLTVYNRPVNRFVAGFIGMPPMNFFDGIVREIAGQLVFEEGRAHRTVGPAGGAATAGNTGDRVSGDLTLPGNGFRLTVPTSLRTGLSGHVGRHVVLGIRPEHLHLRMNGSADLMMEMPAVVNVIEPLGSVTDVYMETNLHERVVGRFEASEALQVGSRISVYVDVRRIHFFEPGETGMNLSLSNESAHALA
jgi:multiple sugar transport system ATP-binding protein